MYHASVTPVPANSQYDWRTVHYYLHVDFPQTGTGYHCSHAHIETLAGDYWKSHISRWNMVSQARHVMTSQHQYARWFSLDIRIVRAILGLTTLQLQSKFFKRKKLQACPRIWCVVEVIHAVFASSAWIRQSELPCHAACGGKVADRPL